MDRKMEQKKSNGPQMGPGRGGMGPGMGVVEKPKDTKKSFRKLMSFLKPYRIFLLVSIILISISTTFSVLGPYLLGKMTDSLGESAMKAVQT